MGVDQTIVGQPWDSSYSDLRDLRRSKRSGQSHFDILEVDESKIEFDVLNDLGFFEARCVADQDPSDWKRIQQEVASRTLTWVRDFFPTLSVCPFCGTYLEFAEHTGKKELLEDVVSDFEDVWASSWLKLWLCPACGYWQANSRDTFPESHLMKGGKTLDLFLISKLRNFEARFPEGLDYELAQHIKSHPNLLHQLNPTRFEKLLCAAFRATHKECEVLHVGKPHDRGVDIFFVDSGNFQWLVQVKTRQDPWSSEGVATVQNMLGVMVLHHSTYGIVASTADHFTYRALEAAQEAARVGFTIRLADKGLLLRMINAIIPPRPWEEAVHHVMPDAVQTFCRRISPTSQLCFDFLRSQGQKPAPRR